MFPRRCKKCRCYVAPQLQRCPRCRKIAPEIAAKPTKEDKAEARLKRDAKVMVIQSRNIHWVPSAFSLEAHTNMVDELKRKIAREESVHMRNVLRSELRMTKATLDRANVPEGKKPWTSEIFHAKQACVPVFISPKKHRYVTAEKDGVADLIIEYPRKRRYFGMQFIRLERFEKSPYARMVKQDKQDDAIHKRRKKAKKERNKRKKKPTLI
jgi:hypothetical protein